MSIQSPAFAPPPEDAKARWAALAREGLTLSMSELPAGAALVHTTFGFGPEIWMMDGAADAAYADVDHLARKVLAARLVVDSKGRPAAPAVFARLGLQPYLKIPRI